MSGEALASEATPDIWGFYDLSEDGLVPCESARRFLALLLSRGTNTVERWPEEEQGLHEVFLCASGPRTDDGGYLYATYLLSREEIHDDAYGDERFTADERAALREVLMRLRVHGRSPAGQLQKDTSGHRTRDVLIRLGISDIYKAKQ